MAAQTESGLFTNSHKYTSPTVRNPQSLGSTKLKCGKAWEVGRPGKGWEGLGRGGKAWEGVGRGGKAWEGVGRPGKGWEGVGSGGKEANLYPHLSLWLCMCQQG